MSAWAKRQRRTNRLVRFCASYVFEEGMPTPTQIYGLCKLTWITNSYDEMAAKYIQSTKIPALSLIFGKDYTGSSLQTIAEDISKRTSKPKSEVNGIVTKDTGFTNFYKAFRNSSLKWIEKNHTAISKLAKEAFDLTSDIKAREIVEKVASLKEIPKGNKAVGRMAPQYLLTPLLFSLDKRIRFPLINGNSGVKNVLKKLRKQNAELIEQFDAMVAIIGTNGIEDAADLDTIGSDLSDFVDTSNAPAKKAVLKPKPTEGSLSIKDEQDFEILKQATTITAKKIHNELTNLLLEVLHEYRLVEGKIKENRFDVLVKSYRVDRHLLIEVKSSGQMPFVRMAVGQLYDYKRQFESKGTIDIAVLIPEPPEIGVSEFLDEYRIGLLWFEEKYLKSKTKWLKEFVNSISN